jgi:hypothetical protein
MRKTEINMAVTGWKHHTTRRKIMGRAKAVRRLC